MQLATSTWPEAEASAANLALLPVGGTEQHGPHAALSTDTVAAEAVAEAGAEAVDEPVVVAPPLPYGISEEHRHFAGTVWLEPDTFRDVVRDVIESLANHGWDAVVLVNGHGGNTAALREVAASATREEVAETAAFTWFDAIDVEDMGHAGPAETSLLVHCAPELVDDDRLDEAATGGSDAWGEWVGGTNLAYDSDEFTENGVVGDPGVASAGRGEDLLAEAGDALAAVVEAVAKRSK